MCVSSLLSVTLSFFSATFNPKNKNRRLHRHPAFFGTIEECLEDCCEVRHISFGRRLSLTNLLLMLGLPKTNR